MAVEEEVNRRDEGTFLPLFILYFQGGDNDSKGVLTPGSLWSESK